MNDNMDRIVDVFIIGIILAIIGLKITGVITISWFWLFSPLIFAFGLGTALALGFLIFYCVSLLDLHIKRRKENERY